MIYIKDIEEVVPEVLKLVEAARVYFKREEQNVSLTINTEEMLTAFEIGSFKNEEFGFLLELDNDKIKIIYMLMYFGRDYDDYEESKGELKINIYNEMFDTIPYDKDKSINISQMTHKMPLADYLIRGLKLLDINY